mmetsp:Transcript_77200/g.216712  ORF Transcript_77200/g.216712 Transcript_77200/m.216712 type:complete len:497 (-) Transcript_77200:21-1511(-)
MVHANRLCGLLAVREEAAAPRAMQVQEHRPSPHLSRSTQLLLLRGEVERQVHGILPCMARGVDEQAPLLAPPAQAGAGAERGIEVPQARLRDELRRLDNLRRAILELYMVLAEARRAHHVDGADLAVERLRGQAPELHDGADAQRRQVLGPEPQPAAADLPRQLDDDLAVLEAHDLTDLVVVSVLLSGEAANSQRGSLLDPPAAIDLYRDRWHLPWLVRVRGRQRRINFEIPSRVACSLVHEVNLAPLAPATSPQHLRTLRRLTHHCVGAHIPKVGLAALAGVGVHLDPKRGVRVLGTVGAAAAAAAAHNHRSIHHACMSKGHILRDLSAPTRHGEDPRWSVLLRRRRLAAPARGQRRGSRSCSRGCHPGRGASGGQPRRRPAGTGRGGAGRRRRQRRRLGLPLGLVPLGDTGVKIPPIVPAVFHDVSSPTGRLLEFPEVCRDRLGHRIPIVGGLVRGLRHLHPDVLALAAHGHPAHACARSAGAPAMGSAAGQAC